jgi:DNA-binding LytR/AlgR family response regulator
VDHAPESYEMGTLRYLIKPINPVKFYEALDVALAAAEKIGQRLVKLKTENGVESINATHILYSEAHAHYQYVTLDGEEKLRVRMTVSELYTLLAPNGGFIRVGSAYIINLRNVKNVSTSEVHLYNNITVPIPRGKHSEIKKAFWDFQCEE